MRKLTMTLTAAALMLGSMAVAANAQTQSAGASSFHAQIQNASPLQQAACRSFGPYCPPGWTRTCNRWGCHCRPCY